MLFIAWVQVLLMSVLSSKAQDLNSVNLYAGKTQTLNYVALKYTNENLDEISFIIDDNTIPLNISKSILDLHERDFLISGPNCFATALYATKVEAQIVGMDTPEFKSSLQMFCKPLEKAEPGAVGVVFQDEYIYHAYVYIAPNVIFEKQNADGGALKGSSPRFETLSNMQNRFVSPECLRSGFSVKECMPHFAYYKCDGQNKKPVPQELKAIDESLELIKQKMAVNLAVQDFKEFDFDLYNQAKRRLQDIKPLIESEKHLMGSAWIKYYQNKTASLELQQKYLDIYIQNAAHKIQSF